MEVVQAQLAAHARFVYQMLPVVDSTAACVFLDLGGCLFISSMLCANPPDAMPEVGCPRVKIHDICQPKEGTCYQDP